MEIKIYKSDRWFERWDFEDYYKKECSIQESSLATEKAIWLWCNEERMHLTEPMVKEIVKKMQNRLDTGDFNW